MGVLAEAPLVARKPLTQTTVWRPLEKQYHDRDTLFLLDPDYEETLVPGLGAVVPQTLLEAGTWTIPPIWTGLAEAQAVPGKYRKGIQVASTSTSWVTLLNEHLAADEFTIEFWLTADADWSGLSARVIDVLGVLGQSYLQIEVQSNQIQVKFHHNQSGTVDRPINYALSGTPVLANQWVNIALTYSTDGKLTLYRDGVQVAQLTGVVAPHRWSTEMRLFEAGSDQAHFILSDLRLSRKCRVPGSSVAYKSNAVLTVDTTPTGTVQKGLLGVLHTLSTDFTIAAAAGTIQVVRTDKLIQSTPIKAGAIDATHPTLGHSGAYSYDWQVVDRTFDYIVNTLRCEPYISIDAAPQILGGSVAPFSGSDLTTGRSYQAGFGAEHPNDLTEFAKIVGDLVHHVTVTKGYSVPYWGVWNEPDGGFWSGPDDATKQSTYYPFYATVANAVKAINPSLKVGGPETAEISTGWIDGLISYCATNSVPLDFISCHFYDGDTNSPGRCRALVETARSAHSFSGALEIINGEWSWSNVQDKRPPWDVLKADVSNYGAAYYARLLIEMQRYGVVRSIVADPVGIASYVVNGALMTSTYRWATLNVFQQWAMLSNTQITQTLTGPPWLDAICAKNGSTIDVFLACQKYRTDHDQNVEINVAVADGTAVTVYVVDDQHSNYNDAGPAHENLESYAGGTVQNGSVTVTLRPRSSALVRIA